MIQKNIIFILLLLILSSLVAEEKPGNSSKLDPNLVNEMRLKFYAAIEDEAALEDLNSMMITKFSADTSVYPATILAYYGGIEALRAKHAFWPFTKLSYISSAMDILESAAKKDPDNLEIRFMRFSILHNIPGILGYGDDTYAEAQKVFELLMRKDFSFIDAELQQDFAQFIIESERLSPEQNFQLSQNFTLAVKDE